MTRLKIKSYINTQIICNSGTIFFNNADIKRKGINLSVGVQGDKSLGGHFARLCRGFEFYEVKKKMLLFFKKKMEILLHF